MSAVRVTAWTSEGTADWAEHQRAATHAPEEESYLVAKHWKMYAVILILSRLLQLNLTFFVLISVFSHISGLPGNDISQMTVIEEWAHLRFHTTVVGISVGTSLFDSHTVTHTHNVVKIDTDRVPNWPRSRVRRFIACIDVIWDTVSGTADPLARSRARVESRIVDDLVGWTRSRVECSRRRRAVMKL